MVGGHFERVSKRLYITLTLAYRLVGNFVEVRDHRLLVGGIPARLVIVDACTFDRGEPRHLNDPHHVVFLKMFTNGFACHGVSKERISGFRRNSVGSSVGHLVPGYTKFRSGVSRRKLRILRERLGSERSPEVLRQGDHSSIQFIARSGSSTSRFIRIVCCSCSSCCSGGTVTGSGVARHRLVIFAKCPYTVILSNKSFVIAAAVAGPRSSLRSISTCGCRR
mmetsp:Transcript_14175/g.32143  ORF Transcript_14175/g.32143 Transcript_14175/m.32143 type:complete len:222 (-) Transcript_14175:325-990(-)